jgi:pimeloyl-ACP methyl ester carboxylesterase
MQGWWKRLLHRQEVIVGGTRLSVLTAGEVGSDPVLLLHGTFWSRVWQPVLPLLGTSLRCLALDFPGFCRSQGELSVEQASVPALARIALEAADALGLDSFHLAAHDIGGAVAQHLAAHFPDRVRRMVLMNAVMFDSWPVQALERFKDPQVRAETTVEALLRARRETTTKAVGRALTAEEVEDYLSPLQQQARVRSWMAMAAAADPAYTLDLIPALARQAVPTRLVWGRDDDFQKVEYARRYVDEIPGSELVEVPGRHIPTEDATEPVAAAMLDHFAASSP